MTVRNVLMYVCDALRWDELPQAASERGVIFKTVAQSTWSPPCFTTLSTGLYPEQHGVFKYTHRLADGVETVYDIDGLDGAYYNKHPNDRLADVFGVPQDRTVDELEKPFFYLERDLTTHAPYDEVESTDAGAYLGEVGCDWDRIVEDYRAGVRKSLSLFEERLESLRERDALDETLVVLTADHGEILGEHGDIAHSNPTCPEIAHVPAVFIHPNLSAADFQVDPDSEIIEQVDIVETVLSLAGFDDIVTNGVDITTRSRDDPAGYSYVQVEKNGISFYEARGAFDYGGGHVFLDNPKAVRLAYYCYRQLYTPHRHTIRDSWRSVLSQYVRDSYTYGDPLLSVEDARRYIDETSERIENVEPSEVALSDETEEQLKDMGYMT
jgi:arylsulfatase A-like enzyme